MNENELNKLAQKFAESSDECNYISQVDAHKKSFIAGYNSRTLEVIDLLDSVFHLSKQSDEDKYLLNNEIKLLKIKIKELKKELVNICEK